MLRIEFDVEPAARRHCLERVANLEFVRRVFRERTARLDAHTDLERPLAFPGADAVGAAQLLVSDRDLERQVLPRQELVLVSELFRHAERDTHGVLRLVFEAFDGERMKFFHIRCT